MPPTVCQRRRQKKFRETIMSDFEERIVKPCVSALENEIPGSALRDLAYRPQMVIFLGDEVSAFRNQTMLQMKTRWVNGQYVQAVSFPVDVTMDEVQQQVQSCFDILVSGGFQKYDRVVVSVVASAVEMKVEQLSEFCACLSKLKLGAQHSISVVLFLMRHGVACPEESFANVNTVFFLGDYYHGGQRLSQKDTGSLIADISVGINTYQNNRDIQQQLDRYLFGSNYYVVSYMRAAKPTREITLRILNDLISDIMRNGDHTDVTESDLLYELMDEQKLRYLKQYAERCSREIDPYGELHRGLARSEEAIRMKEGNLNADSADRYTFGGWSALYKSHYLGQVKSDQMEKIRQEIKSYIKKKLDYREIQALNGPDYQILREAVHFADKDVKPNFALSGRGDWGSVLQKISEETFIRDLHSQFAPSFGNLLTEMIKGANRVQLWLNDAELSLKRLEIGGQTLLTEDIPAFYDGKINARLTQIDQSLLNPAHNYCSLDIDGDEEDWSKYICDLFKLVIDEPVFRLDFANELKTRLGQEFEQALRQALDDANGDQIRESYYQVAFPPVDTVLFSGGNEQIGSAVTGATRIHASGEVNAVCLLKIYAVMPTQLISA